MENRKDLEQAKELFMAWLKDKNARDVKDTDDSCELFPYCHHVRGIINGRLINVTFNLSIKLEHGSIRYYYKDVQGCDLNIKEFVQLLSDIKIEQPEYTLERWELKDNEQVVISQEEGITIYELRNKN